MHPHPGSQTLRHFRKARRAQAMLGRGEQNRGPRKAGLLAMAPVASDRPVLLELLMELPALRVLDVEDRPPLGHVETRPTIASGDGGGSSRCHEVQHLVLSRCRGRSRQAANR